MLYETPLTATELARYPRQVILPAVGASGQKRITEACVLIVGLGGLGSPVLAYLCSAGVGTIGVVDHDVVEMHNLQRQIIHAEKCIGMSKSESAHGFGTAFNSSITIRPYSTKLTAENIAEIAHEYEVLADCTDSVDCRYLISDYCKKTNKDMVLASVLRFSGQVFVLPRGSPCFRCIFPIKSTRVENCDEAGVLGAACGVIGSMQSMEIIKVIMGVSQPLIITYDAMECRFKKITLRDRKECCSQQSPTPNICTESIPADKKHWVTWKEYLTNSDAYQLVDVRSKNLFDVCHLKNCMNWQMDRIESFETSDQRRVLLVCKRGVTAQRACEILRKKRENVFVAKGGLVAFKQEVDDGFFV